MTYGCWRLVEDGTDYLSTTAVPCPRPRRNYPNVGLNIGSSRPQLPLDFRIGRYAAGSRLREARRLSRDTSNQIWSHSGAQPMALCSLFRFACKEIIEASKPLSIGAVTEPCA